MIYANITLTPFQALKLDPQEQTLKLWNLFVSCASRNTACIICDMFTHELESARDF